MAIPGHCFSTRKKQVPKVWQTMYQPVHNIKEQWLLKSGEETTVPVSVCSNSHSYTSSLSQREEMWASAPLLYMPQDWGVLVFLLSYTKGSPLLPTYSKQWPGSFMILQQLQSTECISQGLLPRSWFVLCPFLPVVRKESIRCVGSNVASCDLFALSNHGFGSVISVRQTFSSNMFFIQLCALGVLQVCLATCWRLTAHTAPSTHKRPLVSYSQPALYLAFLAPHHQAKASHKPLHHHSPSQGPTAYRKMLFLFLKALFSSLTCFVSCLQFKADGCENHLTEQENPSQALT